MAPPLGQRLASDGASFKRPRPEDSESDSEPVIDTWPRFLVITSKNPEQTFDKVSPFVVAKALKGSIGESYKDAKILRSGKVLVECARKQQAVQLLSLKVFGNIPVDITPHNSLNFCKGVIRSYDFRNANEEEMFEELKHHHVTEVKRVYVTHGGNKTKTNTFILTFDVPTLPSRVKAALSTYPVEPFVPNPLRCFNCQKFGHHKDKCGKDKVCARCGHTGHDSSSCENPLQCPNCKGDHFAYSKECPRWKQEKEIQAVKVTQNLTFKAARKLVESRTPGGPSAQSYADVSRPTASSSSSTSTPSAPTSPCSCSTTLRAFVEKICLLFPEKAADIRKLVQSDDGKPPKQSLQNNEQKTQNLAGKVEKVKAPASEPLTSTPANSTGTSNHKPANQRLKKSPPRKENQKSSEDKGKRSPSKQKPRGPKPPKPPKPGKASKLQYLRFSETGAELEIEKIPTHKNRFSSFSEGEDLVLETPTHATPPSTLSGEESEMEEDKTSGNAFEDPDSWNKKCDSRDSWQNAPI